LALAKKNSALHANNLNSFTLGIVLTPTCALKKKFFLIEQLAVNCYIAAQVTVASD